jgi:mRNA interferase MazF
MPPRPTVSMNAEGRLVRGDVWSVDFGADPEDPEQAFRRPALIIFEGRLHHPNLRMVIVVPGASQIRPAPLHVVAGPDGEAGLLVATAFQVEQVRAVSIGRLVERLGRLDPVSRHSIDEILRNALGP